MIVVNVVYTIALLFEWFSNYSGLVKSVDKPDRLSLLMLHLNYFFLILFGVVFISLTLVFVHNIWLVILFIILGLFLRTFLTYYLVLALGNVIIKREEKHQLESLKNKVMAPSNDVDKEVQEAVEKGVNNGK